MVLGTLLVFQWPLLLSNSNTDLVGERQPLGCPQALGGYLSTRLRRQALVLPTEKAK